MFVKTELKEEIRAGEDVIRKVLLLSWLFRGWRQSNRLHRFEWVIRHRGHGSMFVQDLSLQLQLRNSNPSIGNRPDHPRLDDTTAKSVLYTESWIQCALYNALSRFSLSLTHLQRNESLSPAKKKQSRCLCYYRFRLSKFYTDPRPLATSSSDMHPNLDPYKFIPFLPRKRSYWNEHQPLILICSDFIPKTKSEVEDFIMT